MLILYMLVAFETAWLFAGLTQANHRIDLCSGPSLAFGLHASSIILGIE